jgi:hypothetical protein
MKDSSMPEPTKATSEDFERDDIELVKLFLAQYKDAEGNSYDLTARPDRDQRKEKAIEAIAEDKHGRRLAVEHTLIQAFEGQKADDPRFLAVFERLGKDKSLRIPDKLIEVFPPAFSIPTGVEWKDIEQKVYDWFKGNRDKFPKDGDSMHDIPGLGFELKVLVQTMEVPGSEGVVGAGRIRPKDKPFIDVLRKALTTKVPKLVATPAEKHILLLEHQGTSVGFTEVTRGIDSTVDMLPDLKKVDEVWVVHSMEWKTSGFLIFVYVWPGGVKGRFSVKDERFSSKKPVLEA